MGVREAKKEARRTAIEEAGLGLFLEEGFDRASVERITAAVGIARGTFYLYYDDKLALFNALCERLYAPIVGVLEDAARALRASSSVGEHQFLYLQMAGGMAHLAPTLRPLFMLHFRESYSAGPSGQVVERWITRIQELAVGILQDAQDRGMLRVHNPQTVAMAIIGAVERLTWAWLTRDARLDRDSAALELAGVVFSGIRPLGEDD